MAKVIGEEMTSSKKIVGAYSLLYAGKYLSHFVLKHSPQKFVNKDTESLEKAGYKTQINYL